MNETLRRWHRIRLHIQCNGWTFGAHVPNIEMQCDDIHVSWHEKFVIYRCSACGLGFAIVCDVAGTIHAAATAAAADAAIDATVVLHYPAIGRNESAECIVVHQSGVAPVQNDWRGSHYRHLR